VQTEACPSKIPEHFDAITSALGLLARLLQSFVAHEVTPVVVGDGTATRMKHETQKARRKTTDRYAEQQVDAEIRLTRLREEGARSRPEPSDDAERQDRAEEALRDAGEVADLTARIVTALKGSVRIGAEDRLRVEELARALGVPYVEAPGEAEKYCAQLVREGHCVAAYSNDTDLLVHGCPRIISRVAEGQARIVFLENVLGQLGLSQEQFVDLCVMCGTDYNPNVPGFGPLRCYELIKHYGSLDAMPEEADTAMIPGRVSLPPYCKGLLRNEAEGTDWRDVRREFVEGRADVDASRLFVDECDLALASSLAGGINLARYASGHEALMNATTVKVPFEAYLVA
jgi:5'-3' exonuclease